MPQVRTRFAPSPTGYLHLGGLRTAAYAYLYARKRQGVFILRIEDTDQEREVPGAEEQLRRSLKLAGLTYDEGPDVGGDFGPYVQSLRKDIYAPYAWELVEKGAAYPCFCAKERLDQSRAEAERNGLTFKYDRRCLSIPKDEARRRVESGEKYVIRQHIPLTGFASFDDAQYGHIEVDVSQLDDMVLMKADGFPTYNFANVIDDHSMGITHILRGTEFLSSTPKYNLLYEAFGWEKPVYIHLPLVMADATRKLSKRHGDPSFEDLLGEGYLPEAVINYIALLGWNPGDEREFFTLKELEQAFTLEGLSKSPSMFDKNKLTWMNGEYIRKLPFERYFELAMPWLERTLPGGGRDPKRLAELLHGRTEVFNRIPGMAAFLSDMPEYDLSLYTHKKMKSDPAVAADSLAFAQPILRGVDDWTEAALHDALMPAIAQSGRKNGQVLWPLRVAISGLMSTPGGATEIAYLLGKDETLSRVTAALERLSAHNKPD
ncbi:MAG: glutamate--tRNA ligase [Oscillospiraceae bacterium]|jgi:glutamyl-tRNA synthetase|nr:glutamate--tRNA ligase [Oscillospiraceae bacterium]